MKREKRKICIVCPRPIEQKIIGLHERVTCGKNCSKIYNRIYRYIRLKKFKKWKKQFNALTIPKKMTKS